MSDTDKNFEQRHKFFTGKIDDIFFAPQIKRSKGFQGIGYRYLRVIQKHQSYRIRQINARSSCCCIALENDFSMQNKFFINTAFQCGIIIYDIANKKFKFSDIIQQKNDLTVVLIYYMPKIIFFKKFLISY